MKTDSADDLRLAPHGAERLQGLLAQPWMTALNATVASLPTDRAGLRLYGAPGLSDWLQASPLQSAIQSRLPCAAPVRAVLFDKSVDNNWGLAWHQDRVVAVRERREVAGFGSWTRKDGAWHAAPPMAVLDAMLTVRVHLDDVPQDNAPLLVAPGSHRMGRIPEGEVSAVVARCGTVACLAQAGDAWLYSTPVLHASRRAHSPARRRVLQVDFAAGQLPGGLEWLGI